MQTFYEHLQEDNSSLDSLGHDMPMSSKRKKQLEADKGVFEDFATNTWAECRVANLPAPLYRPGILKLDDSPCCWDLWSRGPTISWLSFLKERRHCSIQCCSSLIGSAGAP